MWLVLILVGAVAGFMSGAVGFGGGMILLPVITYFFGVEVAVPVSTISQLMSNLSKMGFGWKDIDWKKAGQYLIFAAPLTALGAYGFAGKMKLPHRPGTVIIGGGIAGLCNGLLGIAGPISSAVFLTMGLSNVAYIASEATAAAAMHVIKIFMYGKLDLMSGSIFLNGFFIGLAMMAGNFVAIKLIKNVNKKLYQKIVAGVMIVASVFLFFSV